MKIETRYNYEKVWTLTQEKDLLKIIEEEVGSSDGAQGTLVYIKEAIKNGKEISVGTCKFRLQK
ncbi:hypothetical protein [Sulfurimonas autotrophica]|uniref:Uncharacterized protein n=1 Tax=Sulfurimonas autotrophica (strain ATCC BAA-671 / DSM 16294 / JCM 11897 / OK10) TaxID=563040 RepID=E0UPA5_SULAO|nr:hypothetical protein [Sulfurimonas autotrophica]ADN08569.1 conserved hypothetical protein [Sulfurimonas autotrophica DSM 16294]